MPLGEMGAFLLFLAVIFVFGNLWFHFVETILRWIKKLFIHFVETILRWIKKLFIGHKNPPTWHRFPVYKDESD